MRDVLDQALRCADEFAARTTAAIAAIDAGKLYWRTQSARKRHPSGWSPGAPCSPFRAAGMPPRAILSRRMGWERKSGHNIRAHFLAIFRK
jgi:hypothetical protein